jgi:hypothetical protein
MAAISDLQEAEMSEAEVVKTFAKAVEHAGQYFFLSGLGIQSAEHQFDYLLDACDALPKIDGKAQLGLSLESGSHPRIVDIEVKVMVRDAIAG